MRPRGQKVNGEVSGVPRLRGMGDPSLRGATALGGSRTDTMAEESGPALGDGDVTPRGAPQRAGQPEESLMSELSELVQKVVKSSSWWERHGVDISILACSFLLLPAGNLSQPPKTVAGVSPGVPLPPHGCFVLEPVGTSRGCDKATIIPSLHGLVHSDPTAGDNDTQGTG